DAVGGPPAAARHAHGDQRSQCVLRPRSDGVCNRPGGTVSLGGERASYTPDARAPTHTPPSGPPRRPPLWREAFAARTPSPHHRARPLRGQRRVVMRATLDFDSPGAGRFSVPGPSPDPHLITERRMARGDVRIAVTLACEDCKRRNYQTNKSKRNNPDRITMRKYCKWCRCHTSHR